MTRNQKPKLLHEVRLFGKDYQWVQGADGTLRLVHAPGRDWTSVGVTTEGGVVSIAPVGTAAP